MEVIQTLNQLPQNKKAIIKAINGGRGLIRRLNSLGVFPGKLIYKTSSGIARGPVVFKCGATELAIGFGMAQKIIVEPVN